MDHCTHWSLSRRLTVLNWGRIRGVNLIKLKFGKARHQPPNHPNQCTRPPTQTPQTTQGLQAHQHTPPTQTTQTTQVTTNASHPKPRSLGLSNERPANERRSREAISFPLGQIMHACVPVRYDSSSLNHSSPAGLPSFVVPSWSCLSTLIVTDICSAASHFGSRN